MSRNRNQRRVAKSLLPRFEMEPGYTGKRNSPDENPAELPETAQNAMKRMDSIINVNIVNYLKNICLKISHGVNGLVYPGMRPGIGRKNSKMEKRFD